MPWPAPGFSSISTVKCRIAPACATTRLELDDVGEFPDHRFDGRRVDVHAAHVHHVVAAGAGCRRPGAQACARRRTDRRAAPRRRRCDSESPGSPCGPGWSRPARPAYRRAPALPVAESTTSQTKRVFVQVQRPRRFPALEADRPDLGQAMVIEDARAPRRLDARPRGRDAAARFAGHDQRPHRARRQRALGPLLAPPPRPAAARRWACSTRRSGPTSAMVARRTCVDMPPPGMQCSANLRAGLEAGPEPEERPERERKEHAVAGLRCAPRGTRPSSSRASTASWRWCRASAAAGRWWTTSGSSACRRSCGLGEVGAPGRRRPPDRATSSALVVNGSRARSSGRSSASGARAASSSLRV